MAAADSGPGAGLSPTSVSRVVPSQTAAGKAGAFPC